MRATSFINGSILMAHPMVPCCRLGNITSFNYPKAVFTYGSGINDHSAIVGWYETRTNGPASGFKATFK